jgi:5-methyltetrahydrofolate--homocysteine methyltransferase
VGVPAPPDLKPHVLTDYPLEEIFAFLNWQMLMGKHLGLKGSVKLLLEKGDEKALSLRKTVEKFQEEIIEKRLLKPSAVFRFFPARPDGDAVVILDPSREREIDRFLFPRQSEGDHLSLSDFLVPGREDHVAMFVTTAADKSLVEQAARYKQEGELLKSHMLQAIAIESAEAFAELLHEKLRQMWGIPDPPEMTLQEKFQAKYRGVRVSFGYPACPRLEDQTKLFTLLDVERSIGVALTEGYMMDPEASVSALVFHHPDGRYFAISELDLEAFTAVSGQESAV